MIFAIILLMSGCRSLAEKTSVKNPLLAPTLSEAIITNDWSYQKNKILVSRKGMWLHVPEKEMINLLIYLENLEGKGQ